MGSCYFALQLFEGWEQTQELRGLSTARETELALRWDGVTFDERGQGKRFVTSYLSAKRGLEWLQQEQQKLAATQGKTKPKNASGTR